VNTHDCEFPEVVIEEADENDLLHVGMKVLTPCVDCGETPLDHLEFMISHTQEIQAALLAYQPFLMLYHWAPADRRKQILHYGLRPGMRPTTSSEVTAAIVCFADSPSWAWSLSGEMNWTPDGEWDLWQTSLDRITDPIVLATEDRPSGIYEIRTEHRVWKRDLWLVGSRAR
jgi:hypothetical protein